MRKFLDRVCMIFSMGVWCCFLGILAFVIWALGQPNPGEYLAIGHMSDTTTYNADDTWAVYWYLCGTDLESGGEDAEELPGAASIDLAELLSVSLPENIQVVVETGGAGAWVDERINPEYRERFLYDSTGFSRIEQLPLANMGDSETLSEFLRFCETEYPADHKMLLFWDHGGGSVYGILCDENYEWDGLNLSELQTALSDVYGDMPNSKPFEVVGFDACLMATVDTADIFSPYARFMVASEETEPACGWKYDGWITALVNNTAMNGAQLGKAICDTYLEGCRGIGAGSFATLSTVDLAAFPRLLAAYDNLGLEAIRNAAEETSFPAAFARAAKASECYGPNDFWNGYTNHLDLGDLSRQAAELLPETSQTIIDTLSECVVYRVAGPYRNQSSGLSCYYSLSGSKEELDKFGAFSASESIRCFYQFATGEPMDAQTMDYVNGLGYRELPSLPTIPDGSASPDNDGLCALDDYPITVDDDGSSVLNIGADTASLLAAVSFQLCYLPEDDSVIMLGSDNDLFADWDNGVFKDNFWGYWSAIDGHLVYSILTYVGEDYNLYAVPIRLNGELYTLSVAYDFTQEAFEILGARSGFTEERLADKELRQLVPGDVITPIFDSLPSEQSEQTTLSTLEPIWVDAQPFTVTETTTFDTSPVEDGDYLMLFQMEDYQQNLFYSDGILFIVEDGEILTTSLSDIE